MLYDPKWENPSFQGVTRNELVAWLETKPADERYNFCSPTKCALAQYLQSRGLSELDSIIDFGGDCEPDHPGYWLDQIVNPPDAASSTFGAALQRARAALPSTK